MEWKPTLFALTVFLVSLSMVAVFYDAYITKDVQPTDTPPPQTPTAPQLGLGENCTPLDYCAANLACRQGTDTVDKCLPPG